ncbi:MAG: DUF4150 domain-containing protein [Deltaproteobacteria bacterium]|nr:DUF4150 domain-containing protein [Deltaproteobacteria bacterium]
MPDTCNTPSASGTITIPYPNIAMLNLCTGFASTVMIANMPALNLQSKAAMTSGDEAGVMGGVSSGVFMGEAKFTMGSTKVMIANQPAVRLTDPTGHNGTSPNAPAGMCIVPSQVTVLCG